VYEVETYIEPAVAWRTWVLNPMEGIPRLHSVTRKHANSPYSIDRTPWPPYQPLRGECSSEHEEVPGESCSCGIYATASLIEAWSWLTWNFRVSSEVKWRTAVGLTYLWGDVLEYSMGYKAQYAYPKELWLPPNSWRTDNDRRDEVAREFSDGYGIPVTPIETWRDIPNWEQFLGRGHMKLPDSIKR
jgi:hypothetical protein